MKLNNRFIKGRASLTALSLVAAAAIIGGILLARPASAQHVRVFSGQTYGFGPMQVDPPDPDLPIAMRESVQIGLLLPAVQKVREAAARMQIIGDGWMIEEPLMSGERPTEAHRTLYIGSANGGVWKLHMFDEDGNEVVHDVPTKSFSIKFLPAVQSDRQEYSIEAATVRHNSINNTLLGDGSVRPILIGMLLPAIQKVR